MTAYAPAILKVGICCQTERPVRHADLEPRPGVRPGGRDGRQPRAGLHYPRNRPTSTRSGDVPEPLSVGPVITGPEVMSPEARARAWLRLQCADPRSRRSGSEMLRWQPTTAGDATPDGISVAVGNSSVNHSVNQNESPHDESDSSDSRSATRDAADSVVGASRQTCKQVVRGSSPLVGSTSGPGGLALWPGLLCVRWASLAPVSVGSPAAWGQVARARPPRWCSIRCDISGHTSAERVR